MMDVNQWAGVLNEAMDQARRRLAEGNEAAKRSRSQSISDDRMLRVRINGAFHLEGIDLKPDVQQRYSSEQLASGLVELYNKARRAAIEKQDQIIDAALRPTVNENGHRHD